MCQPEDDLQVAAAGGDCNSQPDQDGTGLEQSKFDRAAWQRDVRKTRITREAAMAKMFSTEAAQQVVDDAVQICGGLGVTRGHPVELLYREVRALRIYEGATEVQKLIIARDLLRN